jgi:predicted ATPase
MARIEGLKIKNYKSLKEIEISKSSFSSEAAPLEKLCLFIGENGVGKSTLLDAMGFLADALKEGVQAACDKPQRGGFARLTNASIEKKHSIEFQIYYREDEDSRPITYELKISENDGIPYVEYEQVKQRKKGQNQGQPFPFLAMKKGKGWAWSGETAVEEKTTQTGISKNKEVGTKIRFILEDKDKLGITTIGTLKDHPRISKLREFISDWYLNYFYPDAARTLPPARPQKHLDSRGYNICNVLQYLKSKHKKELEKIIKDISKKIPSIQSINLKETDDKRLLIQFNELGYVNPFFQSQMSDGTLKLFTYLLLLHSPEQRSFIGVEEPENGLYHKIHYELAKQFSEYAEKPNSKAQIFIVSHSTYLADALKPTQVYILQKRNGVTTAIQASRIPNINELIEEGIPLGSLWYSDHLHTES